MTTIGYLGIPGSYSYVAAQLLFEMNDSYVGGAAFKDIFARIIDGQTEYGVIPIENSLTGSITDNYDLLGTNRVAITAEHYLHIQHAVQVSPAAIVARKNLDEVLTGVKEVYSHPKALEQCAALFARYPHLELRSCSDTATAAQLVAQQRDPTIAAIASPQAAVQYGLQIIKKCPENASGNYTRFLVISKKGPPPADSVNKCSVVGHLPHRSGALHELLAILAKHRCNLTTIESRPLLGQPFEYAFYIDFTFTARKGQDVAVITKELAQHCTMLGVLGIYQKASVH